jgi:hypothetical protein
MHQDFTVEMVGAPKAAIMASLYGFTGRIKLFDAADAAESNNMIICADNAGVRKKIFDEVLNSSFKTVIDMRCEGDMLAVFTKKAGRKFLMNSLGQDSTSEVGRSCQLAEDVEAGIIELGNFAVAPIGAQVLLNMYRGEDYPAIITRGVL